jgi:cytoskeletal protein RodZ
MSSSVFTGPLIAGNVIQSDGTGALSGVGGSSGTQNVGFASMMQMSESSSTGLISTAFTQAGTTSGTAVNIVIPAQSVITDIYVYVTAAFSGAATLSIGTTAANSNELVNTIPNASLVVGQLSLSPQVGSGTLTQVNNWLNISNTQDQMVYVKSSATGTGTFFVVVSYIQAINGFTNGQYT